MYTMRAREVEDAGERARLWELAVAAFWPYEEYQNRTSGGFRSLLRNRRSRDSASGT